MNKILKLTLILFIVCAVTAGILGGVYEITVDRISEQKVEKTRSAYAAVLEADSYEAVSFDKAVFGIVESVNKASNGEGYVVVTTFSGAQGRITMATGVDNGFRCTGISIISHSETSGLGALAASASEKGVSFRAQFLGEGSDIALKKAGGNIDALTGATITSRAIASAAAISIAVVESIEKGV